MRPAVSVIVPAYGVADYIAETLESVLAQTVTDFEIVVVNDGCPQSAALERALEPYRNRIEYLRQPNGGPSAARNAGIRAARAPLIAFLDGDDTWMPNYLEVQLGLLAREPEVDVVYPNGLIFGDTPHAGRETMEFSPSRGPVTFESLVLLECSVTLSVTGRRETFVRAGGFDESLRRAEDFDLWLRIVKAGGRIVYHRTPLLRYRRRAGSLSADGAAMREAGLLVLERAAHRFELSDSERAALERARCRFAADLAYLRAREALDRGDAAAALSAFRHVGALQWSARNALRVALLRVSPRLALRLAGSR